MVVYCRGLNEEITLFNIEKCISESIHLIQGAQQYSDVPPILSNFVWFIFFSLVSYFLQLLTDNYSHVDRLWSIVPVFYSWNYIYVAWNRGLDADVRLVVLVLLITQWGGRLTFNFYRRGGYKWTGEDYRWAYVRTWFPNRILWEAFSFSFIAFYDHFLLYLITCPLQIVFKVWENKFKSDIYDNWSILDSGLALLFAGFLILETVADQEQWNFQETKYAMLKKGKKLHELPNPYNIGFCTSGVFAYSRHPNFFAEQGLWWTVYLFSVSASGHHNWTALGAFLLTLLFQGSTRLTEYLTTKKFPNYTKYQDSVSMLIPMWPKKHTPTNAKTE